MKSIIGYLKYRAAEAEKDGEDMNAASWNYQEGVLISANDAKEIVETYEAVLAYLESTRQTHLMVEDGWYSCPMAGEDVYYGNEPNTVCSCGAQEFNANLDAMIERMKSELHD